MFGFVNHEFSINSGKPELKALSANGQSIYPAQQAIYIYGPNQWRLNNAANLIDKAANDYMITPGIGAHKLHIRKLPWNKARRTCLQEGGEYFNRDLCV